MIIGAITESADTETGAASSGENGTALIHFYNMSDAIAWAEMQSLTGAYGTSGTRNYCLCTVINTDTQQHRWWWGGVEYTG